MIEPEAARSDFDRDEENLALCEAYGARNVNHDTVERYRGYMRKEVLVNRCRDCGTWHEPPKPICPHCWSKNVKATAIAGTGKIYLSTCYYHGPPFDDVDYAVGYPVVTVELDEGIRLSGTVVAATPDQVQIGSCVRVDWIERNGVPRPAFRLTESAAA